MPMTSPRRLSAEEDATLRRLRVLSQFGAVAGNVHKHYQDLRSRDRRGEVRDPADPTVAQSQREKRRA
jgi:hypothetical protein